MYLVVTSLEKLTQLPGRLFSPSDISKNTVQPLFIAFSNWYWFL